MIVQVDFPVWGRCVYELNEPPKNPVQAFHAEAGMWTFWRNAQRHASYDLDWRVANGDQIIGWDVEHSSPEWADGVLMMTGCI